MGNQLKAMGVNEIKSDDFKAGVAAVFEGTEPAMPIEDAQKIINEYLQELEKKATAAARAAGDKFLSENAEKAGVKNNCFWSAIYSRKGRKWSDSNCRRRSYSSLYRQTS